MTAPRQTRPLPTKVPALQGAVEATGGETHTSALLANGTAKCWGDNAAGDVGDGTLTVNRLSAVTVVGMTGSSVSYTTNWTDAELPAFQNATTKLGQTPQELQKSGVGLFEFLLAISNPRPAPENATAPSTSGPNAYTTTWSPSDISWLWDVQAQYGLNARQAQKFGVFLIEFLLAISS